MNAILSKSDEEREILSIRDILESSKGITVDDVVELSRNGMSWRKDSPNSWVGLLLPYGNRITVDFNKMALALYNAGYRRKEMKNEY